MVTEPEHPQEELLSRVGEKSLLFARWFLAAIYLGLILVLGIITISFFGEIFKMAVNVLGMDKSGLIIQALTLMDMALLAALLVMVMVSGYDNFVADLETDEGGINWMSRVDSDSIKLKIAAAIVVISSVRLLKVYMEIGTDSESTNLLWYTIIHAVFVLSAIGLALFNRIKHTTASS